MLTILNGTESLPLNYDDYYVQEVYGGKDAIGFTLPLDHPDYSLLFEETPFVDTETGQRYLIKAIDEGQTTVNIKGELDLDEFSENMLLNYSNGSDTVLNTVSSVLPGGWTVQDHAYFNQRRTIELEAATPLDVIDTCQDTYSVVFRFDNAAHTVHIYNPDSEEISGVFLTDELNLKSVNFKGKSSGFATRLYARGKDNLTFSSINAGKDYVEDFSYSDKIISVYWKDERYTIAENLLDDAKKKLKAMAVPQQSYTCSVMDLARATEQHSGKDDNIYSFLEFKLYQNVVLLDRKRKRRIVHTVAGIKRYPKYPEKNEITLSTVAPSIQNSVKSIQTQMEKPISTFNQIRQAGLEAAGETITGQLGGNYIVTMNPETQKPNGWAVMDTDNTETAVNVWRMTLGGLGHSSNGFNGTPNIALTMDGKINASMILVGELWANLIKTGRIQSQSGEVYFDLDANNGTGELAASILKGVEEGSTTTARVGIGTYAGGDTYEGLSVRTTSGAGGSLTIGIDREVSDYTLANKTDLFASGDLIIRSQAITTNPGGNNGINLAGNSTTGEGYVRVFRGNPNGTDSILIGNQNRTGLYYQSNGVLVDEEKVEFAVGGYSRASIESNGAYFGNIYSNGILVTSDRKKKSNISRYSNSALDQVKSSAVYQYRLLTQEKTKKGRTKTKANQFESIGILFDEAPSEIRRTDSKGNNTVDLYGMVSILWKAVQELSEKIERLEGQADGI